MSTVNLAPAEGEKELNIASRLCIVRQLFVVMITQVLRRNSQILKIFFTVCLKVIVQLAVRTLLAEGLELHLLKLYGAESKVTGGNFVTERLAYLTD